LIANQDGGILTYFDDPWKIEDLTKSKNFCGKLLQKTSCVILVKKIFGVRCTLNSQPRLGTRKIDGGCKT